MPALHSRRAALVRGSGKRERAERLSYTRTSVLASDCFGAGTGERERAGRPHRVK